MASPRRSSSTTPCSGSTPPHSRCVCHSRRERERLGNGRLIYVCLVWGWKVDKVIDVLEEMRDLGIKADEFTYNTAIGAFAKVGDYRQALR